MEREESESGRKCKHENSMGKVEWRECNGGNARERESNQKHKGNDDKREQVSARRAQVNQ